MRIAVYVRVSTQTPCQTQSIEHQLQRLRAHVQTQGWELPDEHVFRDDGYSGASLNRPGLDRLRERIAQRAFDRVLITAPDRLARKYVHQVLLLEEFDQHDCQTEFLERPMSQDPHDQLVLQIRGAVAEYERSLITDRMRRGRQAKLRAGLLLPWTRPPYGYRVDPDRPRDPWGVRLEPAEAVTVAEMAAYYLEDGRSLFGLAKHLMAMGVLTPSGKKRWNQATVRGILTNPVYIGKVYAGRNRARPARIRRSALKPLGNPTSGHEPASPEDWILVAEVPAILTQEQFDLIQAKLAQNQKFASRNNTSHEYLLRALVSCGLCGLACTARSCHPGYAYYTCRAKQHPIQSCRDERCPSRFIPATQLDALVWQDLCEILTHPELITQALERAQGGQWLPQELQARQENLRKARRSLEQQLERLTEAYLSNVIPLAEYQRRRQDLEQRQVTLEQQAQQLMASVDRQVELAGLAIGIEDFCQRVQRGLADATFEQKRQLVELLIDRVVVTNDEVEIRYVIPTHPRSEHIRFCHLRKDYFDLPTAAVPTDDLLCLLKRGHRSVGEQHPFDRLLHLSGGVFFPRRDGIEGDSRQLLAVGPPRWLQDNGHKPDRDGGLPGRTGIIARNLHRQVADHRLPSHFRPQLADLNVEQGSIRRSADQQGSVLGLNKGKHLVDVSFPVTDGDDFHPCGCQCQSLLEGLQPAVAFLFLDRQQATLLWSMRGLVLGPSQDSLGEESKWQSIREDG
jgi:site-specific DNA recombinase